MQMALCLLSDLVTYFSLIIPLIFVKQVTRAWWLLLKNISQVPGSNTNTKIFLAWYLTFWLDVIPIIYFEFKTLDLISNKIFIFDLGISYVRLIC